MSLNEGWSDYKTTITNTEVDELKDITKDALRAISHTLNQYELKDEFLMALSSDFASLMIRFNKFK